MDSIGVLKGKIKENVMPFTELCSFLAYALITSVTPGPNNIVALSSAAGHGLRGSAALLAGMGAGFLAVMLLCAGAVLGLAQVLPDLAARLAWPGALYILWLSWGMAQDRGGATAGKVGNGRAPGFLSGLALQFVNVKIILYGLTALSVFVLPHGTDMARMLGWSLTLTAVGMAGCLLWALAGSLLQGLFRRHGRALNRLLAAMLACCALAMLV